jgi:hypothetical protein
MIARSEEDLHNIRLAVERIHKLSDRLIGLGPFGVGLDGILSFIPIPGVGVAYSGLAALALMVQAVRARASPGVLFHMAVILAIDTLLDVPASADLLPLIPFAGVADTLFTGHKWAANLLLRHMDDTLYIEGSRQAARGSADHHELLGRIRSRTEKRRLVYLG